MTVCLPLQGPGGLNKSFTRPSLGRAVFGACIQTEQERTARWPDKFESRQNGGHFRGSDGNVRREWFGGCAERGDCFAMVVVTRKERSGVLAGDVSPVAELAKVGA